MKGHKMWTAAEIRRASGMWASGERKEEIAAALERSLHSVRRCIDRNRDIFPRKREREHARSKWPSADILEASSQWCDGRQTHLIARHFNTSSKAILELASRYRGMFPYRSERETRIKISEGRRHSGGGRQRKLVDPVVEGIWQGRTLEDIAFEQGVTQQAISSRIAGWGLTRKEISSVPQHMRAEFMASI